MTFVQMISLTFIEAEIIWILNLFLLFINNRMRATVLNEMFYAITTDNSNQKVNKDRSTVRMCL